MKNQSKSGVGTPEKQPHLGAFSVTLGSALGPFSLYEDEDCMAHIIDGNTRIILSDAYAYDGNAWETISRMKWLVAALNAAWEARDGLPREWWIKNAEDIAKERGELFRAGEKMRRLMGYLPPASTVAKDVASEWDAAAQPIRDMLSSPNIAGHTPKERSSGGCV